MLLHPRLSAPLPRSAQGQRHIIRRQRRRILLAAAVVVCLVD
jgi:hypothetical protein